MKKFPDIIFLVGPTGVGKTQAAVELASILDAEIVSCDAMQVYREAFIASDKPDQKLCQRVRHHVIDVVSVEEEFNAAKYAVLANNAISDIRRRGKVPLVVGGSGMYMMALLDGLFEGGGVDMKLRATFKSKDMADLRRELLLVDPTAALKIKENDRQRTVRALEVFYSTGMPISSQQQKRRGLWGTCDIRILALSRPREELYRRAEMRIDQMFDIGIVDEVKRLVVMKLSSTASRIIGVPEIKGYLDGEHDLNRAKYLMKQNTRHYIKRQMTWFRRDQRLMWVTQSVDVTPHEAALKLMGVISFLPKQDA